MRNALFSAQPKCLFSPPISRRTRRARPPRLAADHLLVTEGGMFRRHALLSPLQAQDKGTANQSFRAVMA
jgi:hypothetical protein